MKEQSGEGMSKIENVVILNGFDTYEHRVELLRRFFIRQGGRVQVLTSDWMHFQKKKRTEAAEGYELISARPYYKNLSLQRLHSHYLFSKKVIERVEDLQPQLLWVIAPPNSLVKFAALYKKKHPEVKLVLDFMDMWPETMPIAHLKGMVPFSGWRNLRDKYLKYADALVTECRLYQEVLGRVKNVPPIYTLYLARDEEAYSCPVKPPEDKVSLCYLGSVNHIIDIQGIGEILQKVKAAMHKPLQLHIIGDGEKLEELKCTAKQAGAETIVHGKVYDCSEKAKILFGCHFGLNIMKESVFVGLTMKSLDYFEYGLPIINNIKGDTWEFVEQNEIGINYSKQMTFTKEMLENCAKNRVQVRDFFENNFSTENFERQATIILKALFYE